MQTRLGLHRGLDREIMTPESGAEGGLSVHGHLACEEPPWNYRRNPIGAGMALL